VRPLAALLGALVAGSAAWADAGPERVAASSEPADAGSRPGAAAVSAAGDTVRVGLGSEGHAVAAVVLPESGAEEVLRVELPAPGYLVVSPAEPLPAGLELAAEIVDPLGRYVAAGAGRVDLPGEALVRVRDANGRFGSSEPFRLAVQFRPERDLLEPNDSARAAAAVEPDRWYRITLFPAGDRDHLSLDGLAAGVVVPEAVDTGLELGWERVEADGTVLDAAPPFAVGEGRHFFRVRSASDEASPEPFAVRLGWAPAEDALEPNDERPAEIELERSYLVRLPTPEDSDRLRVRVPGPGVVRFSTYGPPPLPAVFRHEAEGGAAEGMPLAVRVGEAGPVHVELRAADSGGSAELFPVMAEFLDEPDAGEPNDGPDRAAPLLSGEPVTLWSYPARDEDWFRVTARSPGTLFVLLEDASDPEAALDAGAATLTLTDAAGERSLTFPATATDRGALYGPLEVPASVREPYLVVRGDPDRPARAFNLTLFGGDAAAEDDATALYMVGIELAEAQDSLMRQLSSATGTEYLLAERAERLADRLEKAVGRAAGLRSWGEIGRNLLAAVHRQLLAGRPDSFDTRELTALAAEVMRGAVRGTAVDEKEPYTPGEAGAVALEAVERLREEPPPLPRDSLMPWLAGPLGEKDASRPRTAGPELVTSTLGRALAGRVRRASSDTDEEGEQP